MKAKWVEGQYSANYLLVKGWPDKHVGYVGWALSGNGWSASALGNVIHDGTSETFDDKERAKRAVESTVRQLAGILLDALKEGE